MNQQTPGIATRLAQLLEGGALRAATLFAALLVGPFVLLRILRGRRRLQRHVEAENGRAFLVYEERHKTGDWIRDFLVPLAERDGLTVVRIPGDGESLSQNLPDPAWFYLLQKLRIGSPWIVLFDDGAVRDVSLSGLVGYGLQTECSGAEIEQRWTKLNIRLRATSRESGNPG